MKSLLEAISPTSAALLAMQRIGGDAACETKHRLVNQIMDLCPDLPNAAGHRHYLEQLDIEQLQSRRDALTETARRL